MPTRLRQAAGQSSAVASDDGRYNIPGLDFNQALTWRAGKATPVADLLSRLQKLAGELRGLEQGQIPAKEFRQLAQDLAHSNLLGHKDKGVRAWALCCIVDILNICAPDAPFNPAQLRDIFKVVNNLLQNLDDPSNAYNAQHVYILNSLTDTKSIVLITDLERSEELIAPLFRICFDIVSGASQNAAGQELAKSVEFQLRSMLVTIIDEANLPQEVIDTILSQLLRVDPRVQQESISKGKKQDIRDKKQDTLHLKEYPAAYNMAKSICTTCTEKMTTYVTQYVGTIIMNASAALKEQAPPKSHARRTSEIDTSDDDDESLADLRKAHRLVRELWRACPDVLINVVSQIESELNASSVSIRQLATEALGDIIAGIGISGPPPYATLDPNVYPLPSVEEPEPGLSSTNPLLVPASPKPFGSIYPTAFQAFIGRRIDKSPVVRNTWAIAVSRILLTDAGGIGISSEDRQTLLSGYAGMLKDPDDKVRHTAIRSIGDFSYHSVVNTLCADGGLNTAETVLSTLAERVTDRKHNLREDAMSTLARIWGTASRDIQHGVERVVNAVGGIPSRICNAMYVDDLHIHMQLDKALYENLLPIFFPPVKTNARAESQKRGKSSSQETTSIDADHIRVLRILTFVHGLDTKAKQVFIGIQKRQVEMSRVMKVFLKACEDYNGGVVDDDTEEKSLKEQLTKYIQALAKQYPDSSKATADLWKFVKMHDRRNYQLIRFATGPEHDYRTMSKAIKELTKRIKEGNSSTQGIMDTLSSLIYRCALIVYNRSHVPAIMDISHTNEADLAETAHGILKEISAKNPEVLKTHIQALCKELEENAPSATKPQAASAADTLKACAGFARKYPAEVPKERKFLSAMTAFALYSTSPRAAKHAVTIILTVSDRKELHAKELVTKAVKDCTWGSTCYLARLATIAQVCLLAPSAAAAQEDFILEIAVTQCLKINHVTGDKEDPNAWQSPPSDEAIAKQLALKIMVNRCRSGDDKTSQKDFDLLANSVIAVLMQLIESDGEITPTQDTHPAVRNRLRLIAAHYIAKLCSHKRRCEELVTPKMFISIALIVINPPNAVRSGLIHQLQKYLSRFNLHARWYTIFFLIAFEPDLELKSRTAAWLKSRASFHERHQKQATSSTSDKTSSSHQTIMENVFTRLLSLLAHHPDYPDPETSDFEPELLDFAKYIVFYLQCVATEDNISLIFHIAQRVKQTRDVVTGTEEASERLYVLSDLAQAVIRNFADLMPAHAKGVNLLQTWPGKVALPTSLFGALPSSSVAQEIAAKNYLPEDVAVGLEKLVRSMVRGGRSKDKNRSTTAAASERKRKSDSVDLDDSDGEKKVKKVRKSSTLPIRKTPKATKRKGRDEELTVEQPSRKSARMSAVKNYAESDDDDADMDDVAASSPIKPKKHDVSSKTRNAQRPEQQEAEDVEQKESAQSEVDNTIGDEDEVEVETEPEPQIAAESESEAEKASTSDGEDVEMTGQTNGNHETDADVESEDKERDEAEPAKSDLDEEEEEEEDNDEEEMEGTPSPDPKKSRAQAEAAPTPASASTRATRATRATKAVKSNGTPTPATTTKANPKPRSGGKGAKKDNTPIATSAADTKTKKGTKGAAAASGAAAAVSKLNAAAGSKGKSKARKDVADNSDTAATATAAGTRRSARNRG